MVLTLKSLQKNSKDRLISLVNIRCAKPRLTGQFWMFVNSLAQVESLVDLSWVMPMASR